MERSRVVSKRRRKRPRPVPPWQRPLPRGPVRFDTTKCSLAVVAVRAGGNERREPPMPSRAA
jgi:hypothetical protein